MGKERWGGAPVETQTCVSQSTYLYRVRQDTTGNKSIYSRDKDVVLFVINSYMYVNLINYANC